MNVEMMVGWNQIREFTFWCWRAFCIIVLMFAGLLYNCFVFAGLVDVYLDVCRPVFPSTCASLAASPLVFVSQLFCLGVGCVQGVSPANWHCVILSISNVLLQHLGHQVSTYDTLSFQTKLHPQVRPLTVAALIHLVSASLALAAHHHQVTWSLGHMVT